MKKIALISLFLFSTLYLKGQKIDLRGKLAKSFISIIRLNQKIDSILLKIETKIISETNNIFKQNNLNNSIKQDVTYFKKNVHSHFVFMNESIKAQLIFKYKNYNQIRLKQVIKQINNTTSFNNIMEVKQARKTAKLAIKKEIEDFNKYLLKRIIDNIYNKQSMIKLIVRINKKIIDPSKVNLTVSILTKKNKKIIISDKLKPILHKPSNNDYKNFLGIIVRYNNMDFVIKPDPKIFKLPQKLAEMKNPVSKYCFEKISEWKIDISENKTSTTVTLINIEEFSITKNKK